MQRFNLSLYMGEERERKRGRETGVEVVQKGEANLNSLAR